MNYLYPPLILLSLVHPGWTAQPAASKPIPAPLRDLQFGTINFLHTTDTHGWHAGHLTEPSFSADWGDYYDFASALREQIEADGNDLLVVDTGDRIEGNGLYDSSKPRGLYTFGIFTEQHMDIICSGNHELYKQSSSEDDYNILVPAYHDAYIASNLDIIDPKSHELVPLAPRFRKFTTKKQGIRVLAFGFMFNFDRNYNNTVVYKVQESIRAQWFQDALQDDDIDLIVVTGHVPAHSEEFAAIHKAIRERQPDIPIQFLGGHYHIRDYAKYDDKAYALASGRFMETIGFQSISGIVGRGKSLEESTDVATPSSPTWFRRYIDNNLYSLYHHTNKTSQTFHSARGQAISKKIARARNTLGLDQVYGCFPNDLWMSRAPFPSNDSIFTWLNETVFPEIVYSKERQDKSRFIITNTGAIRFDIFKGEFTKDAEYIVSPFTSPFAYIKDVPYDKATQAVKLLNSYGQVLSQGDAGPDLEVWRLAPPEQYGRTSDFHAEKDQISTNSHTNDYSSTHQIALSEHDSDKFVFPGYTTTDDAGTDGDDTVHSPISFYRVPNVVQSYVRPDSYSPSPSREEVVDVIYNAFISPYIIRALNYVGHNVTEADIGNYLPGKSMTELITQWVRENYARNCDADVLHRSPAQMEL